MKLKKCIAFVVASVMLMGMFSVSASAKITNPTQGEYYVINLSEVLGYNFDKVHEVVFNITATGTEYNGAIVLNGQGVGWNQDRTYTGHLSRLSTKSDEPFFSNFDLSVDGSGVHGWAEIFLVVWWSDSVSVTVDSYELYDKSGNVVAADPFPVFDEDEDEDEDADEGDEDVAEAVEADEEEADEPEEEDEAEEAAPAPATVARPVSNVTDWPDFKVSSDFIAANPQAIGAPPIADSTNPAPAWWAWIFRK